MAEKFLFLSSTHVNSFFERKRQLHGVLAVVEGVLPGVQQKDEPKLSGRVALQHVLDGDEVLQRFRHLAAGDRQVAGMKEVPDPVVVVVVSLEIVFF